MLHFFRNSLEKNSRFRCLIVNLMCLQIWWAYLLRLACTKFLKCFWTLKNIILHNSIHKWYRTVKYLFLNFIFNSFPWIQWITFWRNQFVFLLFLSIQGVGKYYSRGAYFRHLFRLNLKLTKNIFSIHTVLFIVFWRIKKTFRLKKIFF